jgi:Protein of unknown function (DUF2505)
MARSFDVSADYPATVEEVHRAFADERYWRDRLAESGADEATLDSIDVYDDGGVAVMTTQVLRSDRLPGLVGQFHRGDLCIVRRETWSAVEEDGAEATVSGEIEDAPVRLEGNATLVPRDSGSRLSLRTQVEVRIPLVGGKIENFIRGSLTDLLAAEQAFTTRWLANNR